jgi:hypothetical protein
MIPLPKGQLEEGLKVFPTYLCFLELFTESNFISFEPVAG